MARGVDTDGLDTEHAPAQADRRYGLIARLAGWCLRHRWIVIGFWLALLVGVNAFAAAVGPDYRTDFTLPDGEAKQVQELLEQNNPDRAGFTSQIVARSETGFDDPAVRSATRGDLRVRRIAR